MVPAAEYDGEVTVTRNPWNLERTSGGSSGGSGVVAATGIVNRTVSLAMFRITHMGRCLPNHTLSERGGA